MRELDRVKSLVFSATRPKYVPRLVPSATSATAIHPPSIRLDCPLAHRSSKIQILDFTSSFPFRPTSPCLTLTRPRQEYLSLAMVCVYAKPISGTVGVDEKPYQHCIQVKQNGPSLGSAPATPKFCSPRMASNNPGGPARC